MRDSKFFLADECSFILHSRSTSWSKSRVNPASVDRSMVSAVLPFPSGDEHDVASSCIWRDIRSPNMGGKLLPLAFGLGLTTPALNEEKEAGLSNGLPARPPGFLPGPLFLDGTGGFPFSLLSVETGRAFAFLLAGGGRPRSSFKAVPFSLLCERFRRRRPAGLGAEPTGPLLLLGSPGPACAFTYLEVSSVLGGLEGGTQKRVSQTQVHRKISTWLGGGLLHRGYTNMTGRYQPSRSWVTFRCSSDSQPAVIQVTMHVKFITCNERQFPGVLRMVGLRCHSSGYHGERWGGLWFTFP